MRTRLSVCQRKLRYASTDEATEAAIKSGLILHPYKCDRCWRWHLTSKSKGRRQTRPDHPKPSLSA